MKNNYKLYCDINKYENIIQYTMMSNVNAKQNQLSSCKLYINS